MDRWLINGVAGERVAADDRGLAYGDGLFETVAVRDGRGRFLPAHLARLAAGCERLGIPVPATELLTAELQALIADTRHATLKIVLTRGSGPRGYRAPEPCVPTRIIGLTATTPVPPATGIRLRYCSTPISRNPALAGLKTLNRLEQVLARSEWADTDIAEGLMCDDRAAVVCGTMSNLFYSRNNVLFTPVLDACGVRGIMRDRVLEVAQARNLELRESVVSAADLAAADDVFVTNALIGLWPVVELAGQRYTRSRVTAEIMQGLFELGVVECMHD